MKKSISQNTDVFLMQDRTEINDMTFSEPKYALQKKTLNIYSERSSNSDST
jgi:hypothetical protein